MNYKRKKFSFFLYALLNIINFNSPSYALIPNIYIPNQKELKQTSFEIGITASKLIQYGQEKDAMALAKLALGLNKSNEELWLILSRAQLYNNLAEEALLSIKKANLINPKIPIIWFTQASIEMQLNQIDDAIKSINKSIKLDKENSNSYFLLGNAHLMKKSYSIALEAFTKSIDINPKFWQSINNKGLIYYELGFKEKAIKTWRKVIMIKSDPEPKLALAIALYTINVNDDEAINLAREALNENPNYFSQQHQKEQLWGTKLQADGIKLFRNQKLKSVLSTASANSNFSNEKEK